MATPAKSSTKNGLANTDLSVDDLAKQIENLKSDIATLTTSVGEVAKAKSMEGAAAAKLKAKQTTDAGREKALEAQLHAEEFIRTQPATALGLAAGLGFLVGMIAARR